jgi:hypothetical protein
MPGTTRQWLSRLPIAVALAVVLAGCGSGDDGGDGATSPLEDPAATEASPEAPPAGPEGEELAEDERARVVAAVRSYVAAFNADDGTGVCGLLAPGALDGAGLPREGASCPESVGASIGHRSGGGTPVWRRTRLHQLTAVSVGEDQARVTATVSHDFAGRDQPSIEEDVIYLNRIGDEWLLAKPSASFYRAIGYPEPPLRALAPPDR